MQLVNQKAGGPTLLMGFSYQVKQQHLLKMTTVHHPILWLVHQSISKWQQRPSGCAENSAVLCKKPDHKSLDPGESWFNCPGAGPNSSMQNSETQWGEQWKVVKKFQLFLFCFHSNLFQSDPRRKKLAYFPLAVFNKKSNLHFTFILKQCFWVLITSS